MTKNKISQVLAAANHVDEWDSGIGESAEARRPASEAASDFVFNEPSEPVGQGQPAAPLPPTAPATERTQTATPPQVTATTPRTARPAGFLHHDKEQPGLVDCTRTERQRFDALGNWPAPPPERDKSHSNPFIRAVLKSPAVKSALAAAKAAQKSFLKISTETAHLTDIQPQKDAVRAAIEAANNVAEITKLRSDAALLDSPEAETARQSALRLVSIAHLKMEASLATLVDMVLVELENQVSEIEAAEVELFDQFGFTHETTPLMGKLRAVQSRVREHRDYLEMRKTPEHSRTLVGDGNNILETFEA